VDHKTKLHDFYSIFFIFVPNPIYILLSLGFTKKFRFLQKILLSIFAITFILTLFPYSGTFPLMQKILDIADFSTASYLMSSSRVYPVLFIVSLIAGLMLLISSLDTAKKQSLILKGSYPLFLASLSAMTMLGYQYQFQFSFNNNIWSVKNVHDMADAQKWAAMNTAKDSVFFVTPNSGYTPWRTLSERSAVTNELVISPYGYTQQADEWNSMLKSEFWNSVDFRLNKQNFCDFISRSKSNYFVEYRQSSDFSLFGDEVFSNESVIIHRTRCD
jgi:hypothetical protein